MKNGGKNKSVVFIILVSVFNHNHDIVTVMSCSLFREQPRKIHSWVK